MNTNINVGSEGEMSLEGSLLMETNAEGIDDERG